MRVRRRRYGTTGGGEAVDEFVLSQPEGIEVRAVTYGARLVAVRVPGRSGDSVDVALGYRDLQAYEADPAYLGPTIGRFANRIAGARFALNGVVHRLTANEGPHHLHGGLAGFDVRVWDAEPSEERGIRMTRTSPAGEEGYPGTATVRVDLSLPAPNELRVDHELVADAPTIASMTNHAYWNLAGEGAETVEGHLLVIDADRFTPVDADGIPTGAALPVEGTPLDFRSARRVGPGPDERSPHARPNGGYDHNFVLRGGGGALARAARANHPASRRWLEVWTTEPCLQVFTGGPMQGPVGRTGEPYGPGRGIALEPQRHPDAPNQPAFPDAVVRPGEAYRSTIVYRFGF